MHRVGEFEIRLDHWYVLVRRFHCSDSEIADQGFPDAQKMLLLARWWLQWKARVQFPPALLLLRSSLRLLCWSTALAS